MGLAPDGSPQQEEGPAGRQGRVAAGAPTAGAAAGAAADADCAGLSASSSAHDSFGTVLWQSGIWRILCVLLVYSLGEL